VTPRKRISLGISLIKAPTGCNFPHLKDKKYQRVERSQGSFYRAFSLPSNADVDNILAAFDKGVLTLTIPTPPKEKPKQIEIKIKELPK